MKNSRFVPVAIALAIFVISHSLACAEGLRDGDIIFQQSESGQAKAISLATKSLYTHMGIIFIESGAAYVYEAVQPVVKTPLSEWIKNGDRGHYVVKRLHSNRRLSENETKALKKEVQSFLGKDYDWLFSWSDDRIYCSELVWKSYKNALNIEVGPLRRLRDFDLSHDAVRKLMQDRYGDVVPLDMRVVAPSDIFGANILETVETTSSERSLR